METKIIGRSGIRVAGTFIGVICAGSVGAQPASDAGDNLPRPRTQAATGELAEIVPRRVELRAQIAQEPVQPAQAGTGPLLAQADLGPAGTAQALPNTAGPLPPLALAGLVSLLGALGLTIRRRLLARK